MKEVARGSASVVKLALASALLAALAAFSCKTFDLPDEVCDARGLKGPLLASRPTSETCTRCVEERCCDIVGVCQNKPGCSEMVRATHECVLDSGLAGGSAEKGCATDGGLDCEAGLEADDTYRCVRERCGTECGLPVCRVDPAAVLIQTASCDKCFTGSCCPELNACYGSRTCKLTLECIINECKGTLAMNLLADEQQERRGGGGGVLGDVDGPRNLGADQCRIDAGDGGGPPGCVSNCICRFGSSDPGLDPLDAGLRAAALAGQVYECGVRAGCGTPCLPAAVDAATD